MSASTIYIYCIVGTVDLILAIIFIYYAVKNAIVLKNARSQYLMVAGASSFAIIGIAYATAFFAFGIDLSMNYFALAIFASGVLLILAGAVYSSMMVRESTGKMPWLKILRFFPHGIHRLIGLSVLLFLALPVWIIGVASGIEIYGIPAQLSCMVGFAALAMGERRLYLATATLGITTICGSEIKLLRHELIVAKLYADLINVFLSTIQPAMHAEIINEALSEWSVMHPVLFEGCQMKENSQIDTRAIMKNLNRLHKKNRSNLILKEFTSFTARLLRICGVITSSEYSKKILTVSYKAVREQYADLPAVYDILRTMPEGVLDEEKLALLSKQELETRVRNRTAELGKANEILCSEIARRKKLQNKLLESELKYRNVVDKSPVGLYIIQNYNIRFCNQKFMHMFGYASYEELQEKYIADLVAPGSWQVVKKQLNLMEKKKKELLQYEFKGIKKDGTVFDIEAFGNQITFKSKPAIQGSMIDISERKQWEMLLRKSEREKALILHSTSDLISFQNLNLEIIWANRAVHESSATKPGSVLGRYCYEIWPKRKTRCDGCPVVKAFKTNKFERQEITTADDRIWDVQSYPVRDKTGNIIGVVEVTREITKSKQFEDILKRAAEQWTTTFDAIQDSVCLLNTDRKILRCNKSFMQLTAKSFKDIIGYNCCEIIHGVPGPKENCPIGRMIEELQRTTETMQLIDGRWLSVIADPMLDELNNLSGIVLILSDITKQKKMEEELLHSQKLESLGVLAGGIAHDFNNILTAILGNIEFLQIDTELEGKSSGRLKNAEKAVFRAKDLVQQLLTFSKGGMPVKKAISIVDVIKDTAIFTLRGSKIRCEFHISDDLWIVDVDKGQISQVLSNVALNAEQAMAKGGIIYMHAENIKLGTKNAMGLHAGKYVKISLEDHGGGIAEEHLSKIFDPYFTTKKKGTGLGLSTSYSIIKKHGGYITVDTKKKVGTTFSIYLPASKKTPSGAKTLDKKLFFGKGRVLVVDDEESVRKLAADILRHCGYEPVLAEEGAKAIELYKQERETGKPFDVVLMDLTIPGGMGGKEAVIKLLRINAKAKIIVSSGYSNDPIMANFKKYGFHDVIAKPFKMGELSRVVYNAIKGSGDK